VNDGAIDGVTLARWLAAWPALCAVAVANGALRELTYGRRMRELEAHQLSTALLVAAIGGSAVRLQRRAPLRNAATAAAVGGALCAATIGFEVGLGRLRHMPWRSLLHDYDVREGRVFAAVPLALAVGPSLAARRRPR